MTKTSFKIISVFIAVCICFTFFSVSSFALGAIGTIIIGGVLFSALGVSEALLANACGHDAGVLNEWWNGSDGENFRNSVNELSQMQDLVRIELPENAVPSLGGQVGNAYINPDVTLSSEQREIAQAIVDAFNNSPYKSELVTNAALTGDPVLTSQGYEVLKASAVNAINNAANDRAIEACNKGIFDLSEAVGGMPTYNFDFVGPLDPSFSYAYLPSGQTVQLHKDGFDFSPNVSLANADNTSEITFGQTSRLGIFFDTLYNFDTDNPLFSGIKNCYCFGYYFLTASGDVYYAPDVRFNQGANTNSIDCNVSVLKLFNTSYFHMYDSSGNDLGYKTFNEIGAVTGGFYANTTSSNSTVPSVGYIDDSDFDNIIDGGSASLTLPYSPSEKTISDGLKLGLISPASPLTVNEQGEITSVNGMTIEDLASLIEGLKQGDLNFDSVEEYLSAIQTLISNNNIKTNTTNNILTDIKSRVSSLDDIKSYLKQLVQAQTVTSELDIDVDLPDELDLSYLSVEHHGLTEAEVLVQTAMPVVDQLNTLLSNLFDRSYSEDPPNFTFYWDSDKNGEVEAYKAFDFSFMEQTLSNGNLADKTLFSSPVTVREFSHQLIIFVFYVLFALKVLKKLPSLLGGMDGFSGDIDTVDKYKS